MSDLSDLTSAPAVTVTVVVCRSDLGRLGATLSSLDRAVQRLEQRTPLYLIDHSLDEHYSDEVRALLSDPGYSSLLDIQHLVRTRNPGFGSGHNSILSLPMGDCHLILNPDVELQDDFLIRARQTLPEPSDVAVLAPRGTNDTGQEEYLAKRYPSVLVLLMRAFAPGWLQKPVQKQMSRYELQDLPISGPLQDVPLLSGCCMVVQPRAFRAVGGFEERFFRYFEDYDLCMRLLSEGRGVRDPSHLMVHHGGQAARKGWRHILWFLRGGLRFFNSWGWRWV